jgi:hypothetical protein
MKSEIRNIFIRARGLPVLSTGIHENKLTDHITATPILLPPLPASLPTSPPLSRHLELSFGDFYANRLGQVKKKRVPVLYYLEIKKD